MMTARWVDGERPATRPYPITGRIDRTAAAAFTLPFHNNGVTKESAHLRKKKETPATMPT